jgi:hypothetical protein
MVIFHSYVSLPEGTCENTESVLCWSILFVPVSHYSSSTYGKLNIRTAQTASTTTRDTRDTRGPVELGEGQTTHGQTGCKAQKGQNQPHTLGPRWSAVGVSEQTELLVRKGPQKGKPKNTGRTITWNKNEQRSWTHNYPLSTITMPGHQNREIS